MAEITLLADMAVAFVVSAVIAGIFIPQILLIAFRKQLFDVPDERKIHTSAVPRLGGIAFMLVTVFTVMLEGMNRHAFILLSSRVDVVQSSDKYISSVVPS